MKKLKKEIKKVSKQTKVDYLEVESIYLTKLDIKSLEDTNSDNFYKLEDRDLIELFNLKREISKDLKKINAELFNNVPYLPKPEKLMIYLDELIEFQKNHIKLDRTEFLLSKELFYYPYIFEIDSFRFREPFINKKYHIESKNLERYLNLISLRYKNSGLDLNEFESYINEKKELSYNSKMIIEKENLRELSFFLNDEDNEDLKLILNLIIEIIKTNELKPRLVRNLQKIIKQEKNEINEIVIPKKQYYKKSIFNFFK